MKDENRKKDLCTTFLEAWREFLSLRQPNGTPETYKYSFFIRKLSSSRHWCPQYSYISLTYFISSLSNDIWNETYSLVTTFVLSGRFSTRYSFDYLFLCTRHYSDLQILQHIHNCADNAKMFNYQFFHLVHVFFYKKTF